MTSNLNCLQKEIKEKRLKPGSACYRSVQGVLSFQMLFINVKIKLYKTIILSVALYSF